MMLGYVARGLVQVLAAHFLVSTMVSLAIAGVWWRVASGPASSQVIAKRLWRLRLAPSVCGAIAALLVALAYGLWEPSTARETVGPVALACAAAGVLVTAAAIARAIAALHQARRIDVALAAAAREPLPLTIPAFVVESRFPVVVLVGLVMSRLFVARRVIEACAPDELDAVVAHELAHARARDNLRRLAMAGAPDLLGWMRAGRRLQDAWTAAAELAADEWAARSAAGGVALASALVKVARLATTPPDFLTASALYRGEPITERVQRLLEPPRPVDSPRWPAWARALTPVLIASGALLLLPALHGAVEELLKLGS